MVVDQLPWLGKGVLTPTLQPVCNWFATRKKLKSQSCCKVREKVFLKSPTSRRLKSVASCLLKALLTLTPRPVRNLFATDFFATDWRSMRLVQSLYAHIRLEDYNRRQVCNWSAIDRRLVAVDTATCLKSGKTDRRQVGD